MQDEERSCFTAKRKVPAFTHLATDSGRRQTRYLVGVQAQRLQLQIVSPQHIPQKAMDIHGAPNELSTHVMPYGAREMGTFRE